MARTKTKPANFDSVLKAFVRSYNIPTKKDIEKLIDRIEQLEKLIRKTNSSIALSGRGVMAKGASARGKLGGRINMTASALVLDVIASSRKGADFAYIQEKTGFDDKKIRNIIFRLNKIGRIKRKNRGTYVITD